MSPLLESAQQKEMGVPEQTRRDGSPWRSLRRNGKKTRAGVLRGEHHFLGKTASEGYYSVMDKGRSQFLKIPDPYYHHLKFPTKFNLKNGYKYWYMYEFLATN